MNCRQTIKLFAVTLLLQTVVASKFERLSITGVAYAQTGGNVVEPAVLNLKDTKDLDYVASKVSSTRVVYVGENHDEYSHHLTQLGIIQRLHAINPNIAIGMEQFQQPFQKILDQYISGELDEKELIRQTEWIKRWRFDYRLYRPILSYAREQRIPVIALNVSKEIVAKVSESGFEGLSDEDKNKVPAKIDYSDKIYRERLKKIYDKHPHKDKQSFDHFQQVQLLWDEGMAKRAAEYLTANPKTQLVVLAGVGHLMYGSGIPQRVSRRVKGEMSIILPGDDYEPLANVGDYMVYAADMALPPHGLMGINLEQTDTGVKVQDLDPDGAANKAGVEKDDLIHSINGQAIKTIEDIKLLLMDASPGDEVKLVLLRTSFLGKDEELELVFPLGD
jgi:uncharacterized iron-regulated protein